MTADGPADDHRERTFRIEEFRDFLRFERGLSARTVDAYVRDVRRMAAHVETAGAAAPGSVTYGHLRDFVASLSEAGRAPATVSRAISSVRGYFRFLVEENLLEADPSEMLEAPRAGRSQPPGLVGGGG